MSWSPNDLITDVDLVDYESDILDQYGMTTWQSLRLKALEDWLFPILKGRGFDPLRLRTRYECDAAFGYTASAYTDYLTATQDGSADDVPLGTVFATVGTDALYLGSTQPFRGLFVRMLETVNATASILSVAYYNGTWADLIVDDGTEHAAGVTCSGGGSVTWVLPMDWQTRTVNSVAGLYWVKVTLSATPTGSAGQIGLIRASALRAPTTFRTLYLIFSSAPTRQDGPWKEKAQYYKGEADEALQRALQIVGGEFDTDASDLVGTTEAGQTSDEVSRGPWALERA